MKSTNKTQHDPVIFLNAPVSNIEKDIIGVTTGITSITQAIDNGANMIGVIADYGAGKSTLTEILSHLKGKKKWKKTRFKKTITINLWDALFKRSPTGIENVDWLTKSFLFQLASGISQHTAKHVNQKLSKNYGIVSFSVSSWQFWLYFALSAIMYIAFSILSNIDIESIRNLIIFAFHRTAPSILILLPHVIKYGALLFALLAAAFLVIGLRNTSIAYSHWKSHEPREPEANDLFETYAFLQGKLLRSKRQYLIVVEDLDRINDKTIVVDFLKELYRFNNLTCKTKNKKPVFLIAVKPECLLEPKEPSQNTLSSDIYSKIFDYTFSLKPLHYADYGEIVLKIIGDDKSTTRQSLNSVLDAADKVFNNQLPPSFSWIVAGHNLTIRQLKERLNNAFSLLVTLKNKDYKSNPSVKFASCAAVAYLESQYPQAYSQLIKHENDFSELIQKSRVSCNYSTYIERYQQVKPKVDKTINDISLLHCSSAEVAQLKEDITKMIAQGDISDDFRMYFYSYPKGCYIMDEDERDISNLLLYPGAYPSDDNLDAKIERIISNKKKFEKTIKGILDQISNSAQKEFPKIITQNRHLFLNAYEINPTKTLATVRVSTPWKNGFFESSCNILKQLYSYSKNQMQSFWEAYSNWLLDELSKLGAEDIISIRKNIIAVFGIDIVVFNSLFLADDKKMPIITLDELQSAPNPSLGLSLVNRKLIDKENIEYIAHYINGPQMNEDAYEYACQIFYTASERISATLLWKNIIKFLKEYHAIDINLFKFAISSATEEKEVISEYINSLPLEKIPMEYYQAIDTAIIDIALDGYIIGMLYEKKFLVPVMAYQARTGLHGWIDFTNSESKDALFSALERIKTYNISLIPSIRRAILKQYGSKSDLQSAIDNYHFVFLGDYPLITEEELIEIDTPLIGLQLINKSKITASDCATIAKYINCNTEKCDCFETLQNLFGKDEIKKYSSIAIAENLSRHLDYEKIGFCKMSLEDKELTVNNILNCRKLTTPEDAKEFLFELKCLVPSIEKLINKPGKETLYLDTIRELPPPSCYTIEWLQNTKVDFPLPSHLHSALLEHNLHEKYLISKVLEDKTFSFPFESVPENIILEHYRVDSPIWGIIKDNPELINHIIQKKHYEKLSNPKYPDVLRPLYSGIQTADFVKFVFSAVSKEEQITYLKTLRDVVDFENRVEISKFLGEDSAIELFEDDDFFLKVRDQLWNNSHKSSAGHKGLFTRKRNAKFPNSKV